MKNSQNKSSDLKNAMIHDTIKEMNFEELVDLTSNLLMQLPDEERRLILIEHSREI